MRRLSISMGNEGVPWGGWQPVECCLPSVRVSVAIHMPSPCAAWSGTLENIFMHGKNLTRRGKENIPALQWRSGQHKRICNHLDRGWVRSRQTQSYEHLGWVWSGRHTWGGREGWFHHTLISMLSGVCWEGVWVSQSSPEPGRSTRARQARPPECSSPGHRLVVSQKHCENTQW